MSPRGPKATRVCFTARGYAWPQHPLVSHGPAPPEERRGSARRARKRSAGRRPGSDFCDPPGLLAADAQLPGVVQSWQTMVEQVFAPHGMGLFATRTTLTDAPGARTRQTHRATLFLWGDEDPLGRPDAARLLVEKMPHARLDVVADASHLARPARRMRRSGRGLPHQHGDRSWRSPSVLREGLNERAEARWSLHCNRAYPTTREGFELAQR